MVSALQAPGLQFLTSVIAGKRLVPRASPTPPLAAPVVPPASQSPAPSLEGTGGLTGCSLLAVGLESPPLSVSEERQLAILTQLPFVVPFEERVKVCSWFFAD